MIKKLATVKTYSAKLADIKKNWLIIDGTNLVLGRLASELARLLKGKHKPTYTPHMDCGDNVIVINADKVALTGDKLNPKDGKIYYHHTGFPGGIKSNTAGKIMAGKRPEMVLKKAVQRMITRNILGDRQMSNLYVYAGDKHPHEAQKPEKYDFASKNKKNTK